MFTGIIESVGIVAFVKDEGTNKQCWISSSLSASFKPDQSVAHNGVCLTVEEINSQMHRVTAVQETLHKTNIGEWVPGQRINLERCLQLNGRLDGHIV